MALDLKMRFYVFNEKTPCAFFPFSIQHCDTNPNLVCAKEVHFCIQLDTEQISALAALQTGSVLHLDSETQISWLKQVNSGSETLHLS